MKQIADGLHDFVWGFYKLTLMMNANQLTLSNTELPANMQD